MNFAPSWKPALVIALLISVVLPTLATNSSLDTDMQKALVGKWFIETGTRRTELTAKDDGTFSSRTTIDGKEAWTISGEWSVEGRLLKGVFRKASNPDIVLGEVDTSTIVEITTDYYVIENRNGVKKKYQRMK